ncbi:helix-turn-helix domain-containing protein [Gordonibacter urolithinfaciens]|uniref:helix-turn-helix domain-containing protein n=1 Tax=Gordonibacter urolithinfaciens TaxID=1335613 RepID=UPI001EF3F2CA|nr:helix-turn-helix domain-containing protein [Gordonibacter urolithinfaciens]
MNGTNGNEPGYPENALVPYPVIVVATKGDPDAMKIVLQHFSGYIARLSMRKLYDERGNVYFGVDHDIRERLQAKLFSPTPQICFFASIKSSLLYSIVTLHNF